MKTIESEELQLLRQEIASLKTERSAAEALRTLLEKLVSMARTPAKEEVLKETLQETLDISRRLTDAERGSLFLLDNDGVVIESILTQQDMTGEVRSRLIGRVLDKGLAGWVSRHKTLGLIVDTETDDRWLELPNQPYIVRSALAVPILKGDELLGILTLLHCEPEQFSPEIANLMQITADQIALVLENARLYGVLEDSYDSLDRAKQEIELYSRALDEELEKGRQIQLDFLPNEIPQLPNWEIAACFYPARQVAGDFYDAFTLPGNYLGLVIADVCDKGVGAALFMALFRSLIRVFSGQLHEDDPDRTLEAVSLTNDYVAQEHSNMNMFATLFFGLLNPETGQLTYVNGGHEPLYIVDRTGVRETLKHTGPAVGMLPKMKFKVQQVYLKPGDILIGYTDGVTEAHCPQGKLFGNDRLLHCLQKPAPSAAALLEQVKVDLFAHMDNATQFDDITILAIQHVPIASDIF
ncbi:PP2C family protein-serine/threonine phosphatase [Phormidesmis sp. 146-12]